MDISTGSWFEYLREEVLTEGLRDIGLPEKIVDFIENAMAKAPEKSKMYAGNQWKENKLNPGYVSRPQQFWVDWMKENFENEIMVKMVGDESAPTGEIVARTITPYRVDRDVGPQQRKQYDEEAIEQNKKIAFVVQNVKAAIAKPNGTWRKTFMKALKSLSKSGVPSEKVEKVKEHLQEFMMSEFRRFWNRYTELFDWLNDEPTNYEMIKNEDDINSAYNIAKEDLESREEPENVLHEFDDGSYWYNLSVSSCDVEAERMGHCGSDSRGVLVSLRKRQGKRKASSSYITMTWENEGYGGNYLYQIKGRSNEAPPDEMWDHIDWFIKNMGITNVQEDGEHSRNPEDFREMLNYLQRENPQVSFTGVVDEAAIQEALNEVENEYEDDNSSINAEVAGPDEHGGEGHYIYMNAYCNLQIDLGWPDIVVRDGGDAYPSVEAGSGDYDDNFQPIPANTYGREARDFASEIEIDNIEWDLPGEGEVEWDVRMLTGAQPEGEEINPDAPQTAHLEITVRMTHQEPANDPDEAKWEFEQFAEQIKENFADIYDEIREKIRRKLVEGEFIAKTAYDRTRTELTETDLKHWHVYDDDNSSAVEFWFTSDPNSSNAVNNLGGEFGSIPNEFKMWAFDEGQEGMIDGLYSKMFGSPASRTHPAKIENPDLNREMASALRKHHGDRQGPDPKQQQLALGAAYKGRDTAPPWSEVLRSNSRFVVIAESSLSGGGYRKQLVNYKFEIFVDARSSEEKIEAVKVMVKYFNDNPDMIEDAAEEVIGQRFVNIKALADATKDEVLSGVRLNAAAQRIDSMYAAQVASGSDEWAERSVATTRWIKDNWGSMDEVEKWVAYYKYALPLATRRLNFARDIPNIEMDDNNNLGKPSTWEKYVKDQLNKLGAFGGTVRDYSGVQHGETQTGTLGEPRDLSESVEEQIDRIDRLLKEKDDTYDLRLYSIKIDVSIQKNVGGEVQETQTEIRGIEGVTTVRTMGDTMNVGTAQIATYEIKFELLGSLGRVKYRDRLLIPGMMKIKGLKILRVSPIHRTNTRGTIRTVRESLSEALGGRPPPAASPAMPSSRKMLGQLASEWVSSGIMGYDRPMDTNDMQYHVMVPVEELLEYLSTRYFRAPKDAFDGMYQNFIRDGATLPVYVAIGKNGRIKITGNEDLVWFAKKAGLQELPVFFSYQMQV
jgi:hypothetical protein